MTMRQAVPAPAPVDRPRATMRWGGGGFVVAGVLLAVGGLRFALPSGPRGDAAVWPLLSWPLGAIVLLAASTVIAVGMPGETGLVGRSGRRRAALIVSGAQPLLLVLVVLLVWSPGLSVPMLAGVQLVVVAATAVVAATVLRRIEVAGAARWAFAGLAVVDAVALVLALVPQTGLGFQVVVAGARPLAVIAVGTLLVVAARVPGANRTQRAG